MPPPLLVASAVSTATRSPAVKSVLVAVLALPVLLPILLVVLLGGGLAVGAAALGATAQLRPGAVPAAYEPLLHRAAQTCPGITAPLLAAQIEVESGWNPRAASPAGAQGLAQFMPATWAGEGLDGDGDGVRDPFQPADAIVSQASFMCRLLAAVSADQNLTGEPLELALAAYNAGLGAVQRARGVPPYPETQQYVRRIRALIAGYADPARTAPGNGPAGSWDRPITGPVTSGFGQRGGRLHAGVDFGAPIGTPGARRQRRHRRRRRPGQRLRQLGQDHPPRWREHRVRAHQPLDRHRRPARHRRADRRLQRQRRPLHRAAPALRDPHRRPADRRRRLLRRPRGSAAMMPADAVPATACGWTHCPPDVGGDGQESCANGQASAARHVRAGQDFGQECPRTVNAMTPPARRMLSALPGAQDDPAPVFSAAPVALALGDLADNSAGTARPASDEEECREQD
jgi:hypothetical protein